MKKIILVSVVCLQSIVFAQEAPPQAIQKLEIDVIDQGFTSSSKVVITADEIKKSQINNLAVLLSAKANIAISQSNFQPNSIFIRGGDSSHVLFLIDGIPFYDAASIQRTISLNGLNLRNIKRIEVIKGSQSVLYGGQALSGVIKIETFPKEITTAGDVVVQGGENFGEVVGSLQVKLDDKTAVAASAKFVNQYNPSPVDESDRTYPQKIGAVDYAVIRKINDAGLEVIAKAQYSEEQSEIATSNFATFKAIDTKNFFVTNRSKVISAVLRDEDAFSISLSTQAVERNFFQKPQFDVLFNTGGDDYYEGVLNTARADGYVVNNEKLSVLVGLSYIHESLSYVTRSTASGSTATDNSNQYEGAYTKANLAVSDDLMLEAGYRKEFNKFDELSDTLQVGAHLLKLVKLEYSTGFKTPSLSQLYSSYGNPNLEAEKVKTYSAAIEKQLTEDVLISVTAFDTRFSNLILARGAQPNQRYENVSETHTRGVEGFFGLFIPTADLGLQFSTGYQEPKDLSTGNWLDKRPMRTASIKANLGLGDQIDFCLEAIHTGSRRDRAGSQFVTLSSYTLLHSTLNVQLSSELSTFVRAENITDIQYQPSFGYYIDGVAARVGVNYRF